MAKALLLVLLLTSCTYNWKLKETNDYFTLYNGDHDYTQGLEVSASDEHHTYAIGQDIYTPVHKRVDPPPKDERPYAGYLYTRYEWQNETLRYAVQPGWIGPGALGKEAQCGVHTILGQDCPMGWHTQIGNRPTLQGEITNGWNYGDSDRARLTFIAGTPKTALVAEWTTRWKFTNYLELDTGPRLEAIAYEAFLDASPSNVSKRYYRGTIFMQLRIGRWCYFLAIQTPATKEDSNAYNYGGIEVSW